MDHRVKFSLPKVGTAPFCPPEVAGTVAVDPSASFFKRVLRFAGPGLLVSIGYMDPGNWATAIEAGSRFGYSLLFVGHRHRTRSGAVVSTALQQTDSPHAVGAGGNLDHRH
jgi:hypothetical protein